MNKVYPDEIGEPGLTWLIQEFIHEWHHPGSSAHNIPNLPPFYEKITIHTSAIATFHAPSDLSSIGGMKCKHIHAVKHCRNGPGHYDMMLVNIAHDDDDPSSVWELHGLEVAWAHLFFLFTLDGVKYPCTLVHWFSCTGDVSSDATGMYTVEPEHSHNGQPVMSIIHLDVVFRVAHLLPVFYKYPALSKHQRYKYTLDLFSTFYLNCYIDHHLFEVLM